MNPIHDVALAAQPVQHDADLLVGAEFAPRLATNGAYHLV
jgi:hypothetical protein